MLFSILLGLVVGAFGVIFALQNISAITVTFLHWQLHGSLALILLITMALGVLVSVLVSLPGIIASKIKIRTLRKRNQKLEEELLNFKKSIVTTGQKTTETIVSTPITDSSSPSVL